MPRLTVTTFGVVSSSKPSAPRVTPKPLRPRPPKGRRASAVGTNQIVDGDDAGVDARGEHAGGGFVARKNARGQRKGTIVGAENSFVIVRHGDDGKHGSEDIFAQQSAGGSNAAKNDRAVGLKVSRNKMRAPGERVLDQRAQIPCAAGSRF